MKEVMVCPSHNRDVADCTVDGDPCPLADDLIEFSGKYLSDGYSQAEADRIALEFHYKQLILI
ncbi:hypothetical protein MNBD_GAMMA01-1299 [hydrothermal vent metagenome]|uniref:Uncharacterized protein n=1 Tax=hydrothermal vent metagenome TaxID=652676 RepID=A0A3B0VE33_9ZZZZ